MPRSQNRFGPALVRVFPGCVTLGQAVAFNMFLAFFPMLLFALGVLSGFDRFEEVARELPQRLRTIVPPGSERVILEYFVRRNIHAWRWIYLGLGGTLIAGTQVLIGLMQGFRVIERVQPRLAYWRLQLRALGLLCLTIVPWLAFVVLTVFGRPARGWMLHQFGFSTVVRGLAAGIYHGLALVLALLVVLVTYRLGQPAMRAWREVLPGAVVATVLWWAVDIAFGFYVRLVPYGAVYGGLAAAIGLLLWMYLTAMVLFIGAAYNAVGREKGVAAAAFR